MVLTAVKSTRNQPVRLNHTASNAFTDTEQNKAKTLAVVIDFLNEVIEESAQPGVKQTFSTVPISFAGYMRTITLPSKGHQKLWAEMQVWCETK